MFWSDWAITLTLLTPLVGAAAITLIPKRSGVHRKHDKRDAADLARLHRAGELVAVRIPSEADERVRDVVRCRETFQREILKSRHYVLKFLRRRGLVFRDGNNWLLAVSNGLKGGELAVHEVDHGDEVAGGAKAAGAGLGGLDEGGEALEKAV